MLVLISMASINLRGVTFPATFLIYAHDVLVVEVATLICFPNSCLLCVPRRWECIISTQGFTVAKPWGDKIPYFQW